MFQPGTANRLLSSLEVPFLFLLYCLCLPYWWLKGLHAKIKRLSIAIPSPSSLEAREDVHKGAQRLGIKSWVVANRLSVVTYTSLFIVASAPAFYLGFNHAGAFNTPDETAANLAARNFSENGVFYFQDELTNSSPGLPVGPRGFVEHNGRAVPIYPLGHPMLLGIAQKIFGAATPIILATVPGLLMVVLALLVRTIVPTAPAFLGFLFLGVTPLWYWSSRVYMNIAATFVFISLGLLCLVLALQRRSLGWLFAGSGAFALAALVRLPEAPVLLLVAVAFMLAMVRREGRFEWSRLPEVLLVYAGGQILFFLLPMALLNWWTYGSPTDIGYFLFYEEYDPSLVPEKGHPLVEAARYAYAAFFPNPMSLAVLKNGFVYQVLLLVPIISMLALAGSWLSRSKLLTMFGIAGLALLIGTLIYVPVSRTNPGTYGALTESPFILASVVRYWMPVYLALGIGAAFALSHVAKAVSAALIMGLVAVSSFQVWVGSPESIVGLSSITNDRAIQYKNALEEHTETNSVIFAVGRIDKWVSPLRRTVGVWSSNPNAKALEDLAEAAIATHAFGKPVYFAFDPNISGYNNSWKALNENLYQGALEMEMLIAASDGFGFWRVNKMRPPLAMVQVGNDIYKAQTPTPQANFALSIMEDGSTANEISNYSFESGLDGWSGPNAGELVRRSDEAAYFGKFSLRLELPPDAPEGYLIRRTESVKIQDFGKEDWVAIARIKPAELNNARAEMRIFLHDKYGNDLRRESVYLSETSSEFLSVGLSGNVSHEDVASLSVQLSIRALEPGGSGIVYWDGVELRPGEAPLPGSCGAGPNWCGWVDYLDQWSTWDRGIQSIKVKTDAGAEVDLKGPFYADDQLVFRKDAIYLDRKTEPSETKLANFARPQPESNLDLIITALNAPSMRVVLTN